MRQMWRGANVVPVVSSRMGESMVPVEAGGPLSGRRGAAHRPQKRVPGGLSKPQREHFTADSPFMVCLVFFENSKSGGRCQRADQRSWSAARALRASE